MKHTTSSQANHQHETTTQEEASSNGLTILNEAISRSEPTSSSNIAPTNQRNKRSIQATHTAFPPSLPLEKKQKHRVSSSQTGNEIPLPQPEPATTHSSQANRGVLDLHISSRTAQTPHAPHNVPPRPKNYNDLHHEATLHFNSKNFGSAITSATQAIQLNPSRAAGSYYLRGKAHLEQENYTGAIFDFNKTLMFSTSSHNITGIANSSIVYHDLARTHLKLKDFFLAQHHAETAISLQSNYVDAYISNGLAFFGLGNYTNAIESFSYALTLDPNSFKAYYSRGRVYYNQNHFDLAISDFTTTLQLKQNYVEAYYQRACAYFKNNDLDTAILDLTKTIELDPNHADAYYSRGRAYFKNNDLDKALEDFTQTLALKHNHARSHYYSGLIHFQQGKVNSALEHYILATTHQKSYAEAHYGLGEVYFEQDKPSMAITHYKAAIEYNPQYANAYYGLGKVYAQQGNSDLAIEHYIKATAHNPDYLEASQGLVDVYSSRGDNEDAERHSTIVEKLRSSQQTKQAEPSNPTSTTSTSIPTSTVQGGHSSSAGVTTTCNQQRNILNRG